MNYQELVAIVDDRARKNCPSIVFPEASDAGIVKVAKRIYDGGFARPVLLGSKEEIENTAKEADISLEGMTIINCLDETIRQSYAERFAQAEPTFTEKMILRKMVDPIYFGSCLVRLGDSDCIIAGFLYSTADVILAYSTILGMAEGSPVVSGFSFFSIPGFEGSEGEVIALSDASVTVNPTAQQLADIAINTADTSREIIGWEPRVAFLSYSTKGSGHSQEAEKVIEAVEIARKKRPDIKMDGELQLDTALSPSAAKKKMGDHTEVAGKANIIIFPNLDAGNITVKAMKLFAHAKVMGPILNGFKCLGSDLSRTSPPDQLFSTVKLIAALNSKGKKDE